MTHVPTSIETVLKLSALLVQKNRHYAAAIKARQPKKVLEALQSDVQEVYNHLSMVKAAMRG